MVWLKVIWGDGTFHVHRQVVEMLSKIRDVKVFYDGRRRKNRYRMESYNIKELLILVWGSGRLLHHA